MSAGVSVLIPSVTGGPGLAALAGVLRAGAPGGDAEIVVADNGLGREALDPLTAAGVRIVPMHGNAGFGRAVNAAARAADGDLLVVTNDDIRPLPGFVERIVAPLAGADVAAGALLRAEAPGVIETAGIEIDAVLSAYDYLHGEPVSRLLTGAVRPPLGPCGGAAAFTRVAFEEVGGFDEGFFAYCEDVDIALRLRAAGASVALAPDARALHATSGTTGYHSLRKAEMVGESRGYLLRKYAVLRRPSSALRVVAVEGAASIELARRHRSLRPAAARLRGWRRAPTRAQRPPAEAATVGFGEGLRRRYARSVRPVAGPG